MESRQLLKEAVELVRTSNTPLTYNAAYTLAQTAARLKDAKAAEFFYRRCMSQAVALKSSGKLRQSYGGFIDFLYENKQFAESAKVCRELLELKTDDGKPRIVVFTVSNRAALAGNATRSRLTLAASVAALLGLGLYVSSGDRSQPTVQTPPASDAPGMLNQATADGTPMLTPMGKMP